MKRTRKEFGTNGHKFVVLGFSREASDPVLNDKAVESARIEEGLRTVTQDEFNHFRNLVGGKPAKPTAAFGNITHGPSDSGSFLGVPYLDTDGEVKVEGNWMRGHTGDLWNGEWEFVFAPVS